MSDCLVELRNIYYKINNVDILTNINLEINRNSITTIIGPNGAGKSSLAKIIAGINKPTSGIINYIEGVNLSYIPQKLSINQNFPITVKGFLELFSKDQILLEEFIELLNLQDLLKLQFDSLSGGQKQRILFANSLISKPNLIIMDEPAQGLDIVKQNEFYASLESLSKKYEFAVILISHDLHMVMRSSNKIICLNKHICCSGSACDINASPEFKDLFNNYILENIGLYTHNHDHKH